MVAVVVGFELSQEQLDMYTNLPSLYKKVYAITECENGKFYKIYRHYLENHTELEYAEDDLNQNDFSGDVIIVGPNGP